MRDGGSTSAPRGCRRVCGCTGSPRAAHPADLDSGAPGAGFGGRRAASMELQAIKGPQDLRGLTRPELDALAVQIRSFLVDQVSRTGGHLGPNLGVVELTIALHRVFESPQDSIVFDTG